MHMFLHRVNHKFVYKVKHLISFSPFGYVFVIYLCQEAKRSGDSISVETCSHYLAFSSEEIQDGDTRFKCAPPIRDAANKEKLWAALLVASTPKCKFISYSGSLWSTSVTCTIIHFREETLTS